MIQTYTNSFGEYISKTSLTVSRQCRDAACCVRSQVIVSYHFACYFGGHGTPCPYIDPIRSANEFPVHSLVFQLTAAVAYSQYSMAAAITKSMPKTRDAKRSLMPAKGLILPSVSDIRRQNAAMNAINRSQNIHQCVRIRNVTTMTATTMPSKNIAAILVRKNDFIGSG